MVRGVFWYFLGWGVRLEVTVARLDWCFVAYLCKKVCALLRKESVSLPLCRHRRSDLLSKGSGN